MWDARLSGLPNLVQEIARLRPMKGRVETWSSGYSDFATSLTAANLSTRPSHRAYDDLAPANTVAEEACRPTSLIGMFMAIEQSPRAAS